MSRGRPDWRGEYDYYPSSGASAGTKRPRAPPRSPPPPPAPPRPQPTGPARAYEYEYAYAYYPPGPPARGSYPRDGWYDYAYERDRDRDRDREHDRDRIPARASGPWYRDEWEAYYDAQRRRGAWDQYDRHRQRAYWDYHSTAPLSHTPSSLPPHPRGSASSLPLRPPSRGSNPPPGRGDIDLRTRLQPVPASAPPEPPADPYNEDALMTFKAFAFWFRSRNGTAEETGDEVWNEYQNYRAIVLKRQLWKFFQAHREQVWFQERYSPSPQLELRRKVHKFQGRHGKKARWLDELQGGKLDALTWDVLPQQQQEESKTERRRTSGAQVFRATTRYGEPRELSGNEKVEAPTPQLLLTNITADTDRAEVEALLLRTVGESFLYLAMGEPRENKRWSRNGFAVFAPGANLDEIAAELGAVSLAGMPLQARRPDRDISARVHVRTMPHHAGPRLRHDLLQAQRLVSMLEDEDRHEIFTPAVLLALRQSRRQVSSNEAGAGATKEDDEAAVTDTLAAAQEALEARVSDAIAARVQVQFSNSLDEVLAAFDEQFPSTTLNATATEGNAVHRQKSLEPALKRALDWHIDALREIWHLDYYSGLIRDFEEELVRREPVVARRYLPDEPAGAESASRAFKIFDGKVAQLLDPGHVDLVELGGKPVEKEVEAVLAPFIKQEDTMRHRCMVPIEDPESGETRICRKLFEAAVFVQKHFRNKHRAWYEAQTREPTEQATYFNQYVLDPNRPVSISSAPVAKTEHDEDEPPSKRAKRDAPLAARLGGRAMQARRSIPRSPPPPPPPPAAPEQRPDPRSLDPRAARTGRSYQDLDDAPQGGVDLLY